MTELQFTAITPLENIRCVFYFGQVQIRIILHEGKTIYAYIRIPPLFFNLPILYFNGTAFRNSMFALCFRKSIRKIFFAHKMIFQNILTFFSKSK